MLILFIVQLFAILPQVVTPFREELLESES